MTHRTLRAIGVKCPVCGAESEDARCYTQDDAPRSPHAERIRLATELHRTERADLAQESAALQALRRELELERSKNKSLVDLAEALRRDRDEARARIDRFTDSLLAVVGDRLVEN